MPMHKDGMPLPELDLILSCSLQNGEIKQCINFLLPKVFRGAR